MNINAIIVYIGLFVILIIGIIGLVLLFTQDDRADIKRRSELDEFAHWIAKQIFIENNDKDELDGVFIEVACRKLVKLGIVEVIDDKYHDTKQ